MLGDDGASYVGLVCVTRDRSRLCIDAECHAGGVAHDRAMELFEARLQEAGEGACISSLPLLAEEIAADVAGDDQRAARRHHRCAPPARRPPRLTRSQGWS